ncbi:MAG: hypothetical protein WC792_05540 [Candidatus Micrarchaeia archaeon]|jgi:hypothetical protein
MGIGKLTIPQKTKIHGIVSAGLGLEKRDVLVTTFPASRGLGRQLVFEPKYKSGEAAPIEKLEATAKAVSEYLQKKELPLVAGHSGFKIHVHAPVLAQRRQ